MDGPRTADRRGMESSRYRRAERDGLVLAPPNGGGMGSHGHRRAERDGLALAPPNGEGWDRTDTAEWRGMVSP